MTKIVLLSAFATPFRSGAEACSEEVSALLKDHYEIIVVTARLRKDLPHSDRLPSGVRLHRVGFGMKIDKWLFPLLGALEARRLRPDIIHAVLESFAGLALVFCRLLAPSAKRILTCQSTNTSLLLSAMHRSAHRITAISSVLVERGKRFGRSDITLIPNGIRYRDIQTACSDHPKIKNRILFVGRLEPMKGVDTLIKALRILRDRGHVLDVRIVGDGSQRRSLEERADFLPEETFRGNLHHHEVFREYAEAEIFCGLSRSEALGNVFLEAEAAGCSVLATRVGGIPEVVEEGRTGILIEPNDPSAAADALEKLLTDGDLRMRLGDAGRAHAGSFDWELIAAMYQEIYDTLSH